MLPLPAVMAASVASEALLKESQSAASAVTPAPTPFTAVTFQLSLVMKRTPWAEATEA